MNEIEKAIMGLQEYIGSGEYNGSNPPIYLNTANLAISTLEKQIPKKPTRLPWSMSRCPSCSAELGEWLEDGYHKDWEHLKICDCGQKLDWSVEE